MKIIEYHFARQIAFIKRLLSLTLPFIISTSLFFSSACQQAGKIYSETREKIGTFVQITLIAPDEAQAKTAIEDAFSEFDHISNLMNAHNDNSLLSEVNRNSGIRPVKVPSEFIDIIERSREYSVRTNGSFDVTVGPLLRLWGFYKNKGHLPASNEVNGALSKIGYNKIYTDRKKGTVFLDTKGMALDLGAIAKGYAVDLAAAKLRTLGINNALINAGGDIFASGDKMGDGWIVGIQHPEKNGLFTKVRGKDIAIVTSGCYERFLILDNKKYCHIIDAKNGQPVAGVSSVTIIAPNTTDADALATCVMLLGTEKGLELVKNSPGCECLILYKNNDSDKELRQLFTEGFKRYISE